jgi:8-oxo-dGTP pyrophosphatase MutT (NUDIX family)
MVGTTDDRQLVQVHIARPSHKGWQHLVLHRHGDDEELPSLWQVVTGRPTLDESPFDAAQRELAEETGLAALEWWSLPMVASFYDRRIDGVVTVVTFGVVVAPNAQPVLHEHSAFRWLRCATAMSLLLVPAHQQGVEMFDRLLREQRFKPQLRQLYCLE